MYPSFLQPGQYLTPKAQKTVFTLALLQDYRNKLSQARVEKTPAYVAVGVEGKLGVLKFAEVGGTIRQALHV